MKNRKYLATLALCMLVSATTVFNSAAVGKAAELSQAQNAAQVKYGQVSKADQEILKNLFDYEYYKKMNPDVVKALGDDYNALFNHFVNLGVFEGRSCSPNFNVSAYASGNADLKQAFGNDILAYYRHFALLGAKEARPITTMKAAADAGITVTSLADPSIVITPQVYKVAEAKGITDLATAQAAAKSGSTGGSSSSSSSSSSSDSGSSTPATVVDPTPAKDEPSEEESVYEGVKIYSESTELSFDSELSMKTANEKPEEYKDFIYSWKADTDQVELQGANSPFLKVKIKDASTLNDGDKVKITLTVKYYSKADGTEKIDTPEFILTVKGTSTEPGDEEHDYSITTSGEAKVDGGDVTLILIDGEAEVADVTWSVVDGTGSASVDGATLTPTTAGTVTVKASVGDEEVATLEITIAEADDDEVTVTSVSLNKESTSLAPGGTDTLIATVEATPDTEENKAVTWTSNNDKVTVEDGVITVAADATGTATITATSVKDSSKSATCTVTITAGGGNQGDEDDEVTVTSVSLNKESTSLAPGGTDTLIATVVAEPDTEENKAVTWTSDNEKVTVENGVITVAADATGTETATITATSVKDSSKSATCTVTITAGGGNQDSGENQDGESGETPDTNP